MSPQQSVSRHTNPGRNLAPPATENQPPRESPVAICETCGNDYDRTFEVAMAGASYVFDSFECAIHKLAPVCAHCGCRVVGHGVERGRTIYCCEHCAEHGEQTAA
jgi:hypothetical protein